MTRACNAWVINNAKGTICDPAHGAEDIWRICLWEMHQLDLSVADSPTASDDMKDKLHKAKMAVKSGIMKSRKEIIRRQRPHGPSVPGGPPGQERQIGQPSSAAPGEVRAKSQRERARRTTDNRRPDRKLEAVRRRIDEDQKARHAKANKASHDRRVAKLVAAIRAYAAARGIQVDSMEAVRICGSVPVPVYDLNMVST